MVLNKDGNSNKDTKSAYKIFDTRIGCLQSFFIAFISILVVYLFLVQIVDVRHYRDRSKKQRAGKAFVLRGEIIDRNKMKLASDKTSFDVYAHRKYFDHSPRELAEILSLHLDMPVSRLVTLLSNEENDVILLKKDVERKTAEQIISKHLREISCDVKNKRIYPQGSLASHILGYYNSDADIAGGIEYIAKDYLEYSDNNLRYEKTQKGDVIYSLNTNPEDLSAPIKGSTLQLTIDSAIQHISEKALYKAIQKNSALRGAVIVMEPSSGEILAMAVYPHYDPNNFAKYSYAEMKNWAITDVYPPGSTFKIFTVACGFVNKKINKFSKVLDTGKIKIGWWEIKNYDYDKFPNPGLIDLVWLFQHSSNVGSVKVANLMSSQEYYDALHMFNFGEKTVIDLPGESQGLLPKAKTWDASTHGSMGYGYGASVTAIQMAAAISAIANKGVWVTPHVIKYSPEELESKVVRRRVMEEQDAIDLADLLVQSMDKGTSVAKMDDFSVAAKTGTSKRPLDNGIGYSNKLYTSMIGFLPATDPKVAIYVVVDSPSTGGAWGSTVAAPVFKEVATDVVKILNLYPDRAKEGKHGIKQNN